jgi:hypothetical protein
MIFIRTDYGKRTWSRSYKKGIEIIDNYLTDEQKKKMYSNLAKFSYYFREIGTTDKHCKFRYYKLFKKFTS